MCKSIKTSTLIGPALNWAVAKANNLTVMADEIKFFPKRYIKDNCPYPVSTDWTRGGQIIEREKISVSHAWDYSQKVNQEFWWGMMDYRSFHGYGPTPLIAAMRCFVASKLGEVVDIPVELIDNEQVLKV